MTKQCSLCREEKPATLEFFYRAGPKYLQSRCKACQKNYQNTWSARNREKAREYEKQWRQENRAHINERKKQRRRESPERLRERDRNRNAALRREAIDAYGCECACCGERTPEFLALDHVNEDGAEHRRQVGGGYGVYRWARAQGFPKDGRLQLLCHNCNLSRAHYGGCPHQGPVPHVSLKMRRRGSA